jgi:chaperonin GroES
MQNAEKYRLLDDRILAQKLVPKRSKESLIIRPQSTEKEESTEFLVIAHGPGRRTPEGKWIEMTVRDGDHIAVGRYSGHQVVIEDVLYYVIRESEVLMVLPK